MMKSAVIENNRETAVFTFRLFCALFWFSMAILPVFATYSHAQIPKVSYSYFLSNFNGPIISQWANITVDKERKDIYMYDRRERNIRIFDENGMEVFIFGDDGIFGTVNDLTVDGDGNILIIKDGSLSVIVCNYRGEPISTITIKNLPEEFSRFRPDHLIYRNGKMYLADISDLRIAVTDKNGNFQTGYDVAKILNVPDDKREENEMTGFTVDAQGNMLYTISVQFQAFRLLPDGTQQPFGKSGGGPGTFGVNAGIASDDEGYIYVADKLRCVVLVFDNNLEFLTEFGYRGPRQDNLIVPNDVEVGSDGTLYVSQAGGRGVSVFRVSHNN